MAEKREPYSQAQGELTEPFCLDFPARYSNQQRRDKNAPSLDNGRASRFSPLSSFPESSQDLTRRSVARDTPTHTLFFSFPSNPSGGRNTAHQPLQPLPHTPADHACRQRQGLQDPLPSRAHEISVLPQRTSQSDLKGWSDDPVEKKHKSFPPPSRIKN